MIPKTSLSQHFNKYFTLIVADTPALREEVFGIRYQVYCEELHYEPVENFPNGMESDSYDRRSIHFLLQHKPTGRYAGCVRTVLTDPNQPDAPFPFERACSHNIDFQQNPRNHFLEISRLAVPSQFRKRKDEANTPQGLLSFNQELSQKIQEQRQYPLIALSLYFACTSVAVKFGMDAFTLMEARLSRHLRICGIPSHPIGDFVDYHGMRGPFLIKPQEVLAGMDAESRALFEQIYSLYTKSNHADSNQSVAACVASSMRNEADSLFSMPSYQLAV